jgi:Holliday junction resolvase RusA-like endonuclease
MQPVTVAIPGAPKGKARARVTRAGIAFTPAETRNREAFVKMLAAQEMAGRPPLEGPCELVMRAVAPIPASWPKKRQAAAMAGEIRPTGKPDLDNQIKLITDALNGVVYRDDAQIVRMAVEKVYGPQPLTVATIKPLSAPAEMAETVIRELADMDAAKAKATVMRLYSENLISAATAESLVAALDLARA